MHTGTHPNQKIPHTHKVPVKTLHQEPKGVSEKRKSKNKQPAANDGVIEGWNNLSKTEQALLLTMVVIGGGVCLYGLYSLSLCNHNDHSNGDNRFRTLDLPTGKNLLSEKTYPLAKIPDTANRLIKPTIPSPAKSKVKFFSLPQSPVNGFNELASQLLERLTLSTETQEFYDSNPTLLEQDKERVVQFVNEVCGSSQEMYCKIKNLLQLPSFNLEFSCAKRYKSDGIRGEFLSAHNRMYMPCGISQQDFHPVFYTFIHELHHAWVATTNTLQGFHMSTNGDAVSHETPIGTSFSDLPAAVEEFDKIINRGKMRINTFLSYLEKPKNKLLKNQQHLLHKLREYSRGYVAQMRDMFASDEQINYLIQNNFIDHQLKIISKGFQLICPVTKEKIHVKSVEAVSENKYRILYHTTADISNTAQAILSDLRYFIQYAKASLPMYDNADPWKPYIERDEQDTYIHNTLELYPKVRDMFFPQLGQWHRERSHGSYRYCLKNPNTVENEESSGKRNRR